jgi:WD40 repeat protein
MRGMFGTKRKTTLTDHTIILSALSAAGIVLGAGLLVYVTEGKDAALWKVLKLDGRGRSVAWSPDGKTLAVVTFYEPVIYGKKGGGSITLWDVDTGEVRAPLATSTPKGLTVGQVLAFGQVHFSPDGNSTVRGHSSRQLAGRLS